MRGERDGGEGDGGSGGEDSAEALGFEDVSDDGEEDDDGAADEEACDEVRHGWACFRGVAVKTAEVGGWGSGLPRSWCSYVNKVLMGRVLENRD